MVMFTSFGRRRVEAAGEAAGGALPEGVRQLLPARFEAVGEALGAAADTRPSCAVVGRDAARDGAALGEALHGLRTTFDLVLGVEPDFASVEALSVAWSEATLEFLHDISCEDPLTGMGTLPHVRSWLAALYREAELGGEPVAVSHGLVVLELVTAVTGAAAGRFTRALRLVQVAQATRAVFAGEETIARVNPDRAVVVVRRTPRLGGSVAMLRELLADLDLGATDVRVWIEGLPRSAESAARLLDDLAR